MSSRSPLRLNVLEIADGIAAPYCGRVLAGFGANVVKVELPAGVGSDKARSAGPFKDDVPGPGRSGLFAYLNANKKSVTVDWSTPSGRELIERMAPNFDLVLLSHQPISKFGLPASALRAVHAPLVTVTITPFGEHGPYSDFESTELTLQALGGVMARTGDPDREPLRVGASLAQYAAGATAIPVAVASVLKARRSGAGADIQLSIFETVVQFLQGTLMKWSFEQTVIKRGAQTRAANNVYPCKDGYIGIFAPGSGTHWRSAAEVMDDPRLADARFKTRALRAEHVDELDALILPWTLEHTKEEIYHRTQAAHLPFGPVRTADEVLGSEHHRARGFVRQMKDPVMGEIEYVGMPFRVDSLDWHDQPAPRWGEHSQEVLAALLGLEQMELAALGAQEVV